MLQEKRILLNPSRCKNNQRPERFNQPDYGEPRVRLGKAGLGLKQEAKRDMHSSKGRQSSDVA